MPREYCTLFDSNYLTRGLALHESLREFDPDSTLRVFCMDDEAKLILDGLALPGLVAIALPELEAHDPALLTVKGDRTSVEYCWTATPCVARYCLDREPDIDLITYLDADVCFFSGPQPLFDEMGDRSVTIVPHRYAPEHAHFEPTSGIYNVQFVSFRRDEPGLTALDWWRERCIEWCYYRVEDGKLGDQKYLDDWTERFDGVHVLAHKGGGVAPWNVTQYDVHELDGRVFVDELPVVFYHFHALRLYKKGAVRVPQDVTPQPVRLTPGGVAWSSVYDVGASELRLLWEPYLERIGRATGLVRTVRPRFSSGLISADSLARDWMRGRAAGAYRRVRRAVT